MSLNGDEVIDPVMENGHAFLITTIGIVGIAMAVYYYYIYNREDFEEEEAEEEEQQQNYDPIKPRDFTLEELREFNGKDGAPLCVAVNFTVYDVTAGSNFYGPGGPYQMLAGRDGSRALAKMSLDPDDVRDSWDDLSDLTPFQQDSLQDWVMKFDTRYIKVGKLLKERSTSIPSKKEE